MSAIKNACPNSTVTTGFRGTSSSDSTEIKSWLSDINFNAVAYTKIKLSADGKEIVIKLNESDAAKDLISMLPCEFDFSDFNGTEKIAYPSRTLDTDETTAGISPSAGDLTLYKPWSNLALFYNDYSYSSDLILLGKTESGTENISALSGKVKAELLK